MSTIVTRAGKGSALTHNEVDANFNNLNADKIQSGNTVAALTITTATINGGAINNATVGATTPSSGSFTSVTDSGNLTFTGTSNRITGDFSNATAANRVMFQTSTSNTATIIGAIPNGTGTESRLSLFNTTDAVNYSALDIRSTSTEVIFRSQAVGTGTYLPMTFYTGGSERMRIDTSGNVGIGTSGPSYRLHARGTGDITVAAESTSTGAGIFRAFGPDTTYAAYNAIISSAAVGGQQWYVGGDGNASTLVFKTGTTEKVRIDSSGNVGIGTSSPGQKLDVKGFTRSSAGTGTGAGGAGYAFHQFGTSTTASENWHIGTEGDGSFRFYNQGIGAGLERMRIDSSGNLLVGTTSVLGVGKQSLQYVGSLQWGIAINDSSSTSGSSFIQFQTGGLTRGSITNNGNTAVAYNTSSDYRLKDTIAPMTGALARVSALKPVTYKWKVDGSDGQGFIAHELQAVVPECVTGEKDAVNEDGSIKPQGIDTSFLVATLTAAIQEQQAMIENMKNRLAAAGI